MLYLALSIFILFLINLLLIYSAKRVFQVCKSENVEVNISIIIAAKNESRNIRQLLEALQNLDYPSEMYEVIIVDDNSTDNSFNILNSQIVSLKNFSAFELRNENKIGKREALSFGISKAKYPFILITDADCRPQTNWLKACSKNFSLGHFMLFGIAPFYQDEGFVNKISCFENLRSTFLSISMASIGLPYTAAARNFGFTKEAFNAIGGYSQTNDTISGDDDLLLREAVKKNLKIGIVTDANSFVYSDTKKTFKEYLNQRARHTKTSLHYLKKHQLVLGFWHLLNLFFLLSPILMLFNFLFAILLPAKLVIDFFINTVFQKIPGYKFSMAERFYLQIFYDALLVVHFFNASFSKIKWK
ncbi:MAG: glycosyltransferase [bacterium]|nr:glycosyltransferase [bacterium]